VNENTFTEIHQMRGCISSDFPVASITGIAQQRLEHRAGTSLTVRTRHVKRGKPMLRIPEDIEERQGALQAGFDVSRGPRKQRIERGPVRGGYEATHPLAAAGLPLMCRNNCPTDALSSFRGTTISTIPCSRRNSEVWKPSGKSWP